MRLRNLILMVLAVMCTSQVMAQSKRNVRKRPAKRTVVNNTKKPVDKTKDAKLPVDSQAVAPAAQTTAVPAAAAPAGSTKNTCSCSCCNNSSNNSSNRCCICNNSSNDTGCSCYPCCW